MSTPTLYRLADSTVAEALIDHWVAWPHTFSPAVYSLHLLNYQKKTLESYLKHPESHVKSSQNPQLLGGAFVNLPLDHVPAVQALLDNLVHEHKADLAFAQDLIEFQKRLDKEAVGQSLDGFYATLPESLRGFVELLYDYNSRPIVRCLESLLYCSAHYKKQRQALFLFSQSHDRMRAYYMSTPRLPNKTAIEWHIAFSEERIDDLFKLDSQPQPLSYIRELLNLDASDDDKLLPLLSSEPVRLTLGWQGDGVRIRYFGHACVLIEFNGTVILIDPFIAVNPEQGGIERFSFQDLPEKIDYVLITHGHHDHFVFETLLRLRHKIACLVVPKGSGVFYGDISLRLMARELGFHQIQEVDPLDSLSFDLGEIVAVPFLGEHNDLPFAKTGYLVRAGHSQFLFAADSNCLDKRIYENLCAQRGKIDIVFLGMECVGAPLSWVYGALLPKLPDYKLCQSRRSNGSNAVAAMNLLAAVNSQQVYIYAIGREPWLQYFMALEPDDNDVYMQEIEQLITACESKGFSVAKRLYGKDEILISSQN
ncbi:MAG: MBL fold metallo-hydrolase [Methylococcaceae bacterium]|jgi:L-ascorbate metabolism protein UlaG (beta-lactamase superfamily)